jgi:hypothetical protein
LLDRKSSVANWRRRSAKVWRLFHLTDAFYIFGPPAQDHLEAEGVSEGHEEFKSAVAAILPS